MKKHGYLATIISATLGLTIGGLLGYLLATSSGFLEGDPNAGMANLGHLLLVTAIVTGFGVVGGTISTYIGLRITKYDKAIRTSLYLAGLYGICLMLSIFAFPILMLIIPLPLLARRLATK